MNRVSTPVSREDALPVLNALANFRGVLDIFVVGSLAREEEGNDLDVVLEVDVHTYIAFLKRMWEHCHNDTPAQIEYYENYRDQRMNAALAALDVSLAEFGWLDFAMRHFSIEVDIHLMPEGWREDADAIQQHLPHNDPKFVRNIAGDAKRVHTMTTYRNVQQAIAWA